MGVIQKSIKFKAYLKTYFPNFGWVVPVRRHWSLYHGRSGFFTEDSKLTKLSEARRVSPQWWQQPAPFLHKTLFSHSAFVLCCPCRVLCRLSLWRDPRKLLLRAKLRAVPQKLQPAQDGRTKRGPFRKRTIEHVKDDSRYAGV
jgi:hypothetical protein